jgi:hypothetical protein
MSGLVGNFFLQWGIDKIKDKHRKHKSNFLIILSPFLKKRTGAARKNWLRKCSEGFKTMLLLLIAPYYLISL